MTPAYDDMAPPQQAFEFEQAVQPLDITASSNLSYHSLFQPLGITSRVPVA